MRVKHAIVLATGVVLLAGFAVPAKAQTILSPDKLLFQCVAGHECPPETTTLTNVGGTAIQLSSITLSGSGFSMTNNCGTKLAPGQVCVASASASPIRSQESLLDC